MNKMFKSLIGAAISCAIAATSIVIPVSAGAETTPSVGGDTSEKLAVNISGSKATVTAAEALNTTLIMAQYDESGALSGVSTKALTFAEAGSQTVDVTPGSKLMFWDSLNKMDAMTETYTVPEGTSPIFEGDTVEQSWNFVFGAEGTTASDTEIVVTPTTNYVTNKEYGFLGIDDEAYKLGNRLDGFGNQKGQVIELGVGGANNDAIGVTGAGGTGENAGKDIFGNQADKYYPTRFALAAEDEAYYRVRATVTTLDSTKDANASLYTERKHPIYTDKVIKAGETKTVEFSVRPTPIYYEKSDPKGAIADGMVNICVLGENTAFQSIEIEKVQEYPVFWVLGDSTVTDGNCTLPFFRLQNYTGVGTGLTKYLPSNYAMVNEGEGGLAAGDNYHFNMVKNRIKAGDYMYVEYGHNHKTDGAEGYKSCLDKYYNVCHEKGATLIITSPIERINTYTDGAYQHSLRSFAEAGEAYVAEKVAAGATDIAYVDLNQYSLDFYNRVATTEGNTKNTIKYYFTTKKGGTTDQTHPNDSGAENLAYEFIKAAQAVTDTTQKAALAPVIDNITAETPNLVSTDITSLSDSPSNDAWPNYIVPTDNEYPVVINDIKINDDGTVAQADVTVQDSKVEFTAYGIIVITVKDENGNEKGKIYAKDQVDNSTGTGPQTITNFAGDVTIGENDTYSAIVWRALDSGSGLAVDPENVQYSAEYIPTDIEAQYLLNEDKDGYENFKYYGATYDGATSSLTDYNNWTKIGSAGITLYLNQTDDTKYVEITSDGAKGVNAGQGSFYLSKALSTTIGTSGRYMFSADMQYVSGGGMTVNLVTGHSDKNLGGTGINLLTVGSNGAVTAGGTAVGTISATGFTNVQYILDMDLGTATVSVGGGTAYTIDLANYQTTDTTVSPASITQLLFGGNKVAFDNKVTNVQVAKLKDQKLPKYTVSVASNDDTKGSVALSYSGMEEGTTDTKATLEINTVVTAQAAAKEEAYFKGWQNAAGDIVSEDAEYSFRLRGETALTAVFVKEATAADVASFDVSLAPTSVKGVSGSTTQASVVNAQDAAGTPATEIKNSDFTWSCDETGITVDENGLVTVGDDFSMGDALTKTVTINAAINGITKSASLTVYGYEYYEDMTEGSTKYTGEFMTIGGKTAIVFSGNDNKAVSETYTLGSAVALDSNTTIKYDHAWANSNTCGQLRTLNFKNSSGTTIFSVCYAWTVLYAGTSAADANKAGTVSKDTYSTVTITVDPETKVVTVSDGNSSATTTLADNAEDIASIEFASAKGAPGPSARAIGISNVTITK